MMDLFARREPSRRDMRWAVWRGAAPINSQKL
jgi:hypothetical protein